MSDSAASEETVACPSCGSQNPVGANFCQECGHTMTSRSEEFTSASETVAIRVEDIQKLHALADPGARDAGGGEYIAFKTDIGKKHHVNQDSGGAWSWVRDDGSRVALLIVADGVSAGRSSEAASRLAVELIHQRLEPLLRDADAGSDELLSALVEAIKEANHRIAARPHATVSNADSTTLVSVFAIANHVAGAWVGDSRIYRVSGGGISRLTIDHSWAEGVVSRGLMTVEQAAGDPRAHMIMRWLGPPDQEDPGIETFDAEVEPGDVVFCCTDGLYMYFAPPVAREQEMARIFDSHPEDLSGAVDQLVDSALARGGYDNITISALRVADVPRMEVVGTETQEIRRLDMDDAAKGPADDPPPDSEESES